VADTARIAQEIWQNLDNLRRREGPGAMHNKWRAPQDLGKPVAKTA